MAFKVFKKINQQLNYLNSDSTHTPETLQVIPHGVCLSLVSLTLQSDEVMGKSLIDIYPEHSQALMEAGLIDGKLLTVEEVLKKSDDTRNKREER